MSDPDVSRMVDIENDILYRKIDPDHWNHETNELYPTAFEDIGRPGSDLSFFVARYKTPVQVLYYFGGQGATRRAFGIGNRVTAERMVAGNYRIAEVRAADIQRIGLVYEVLKGHEASTGGHVTVINGRHHAIRILRFARCLTEQETFGNT